MFHLALLFSFHVEPGRARLTYQLYFSISNPFWWVPLYQHTSFYYVSQYITFLKIEGLWQPCVYQVCCAIIPAASAHFVSPSHILVILAVFQAFSLLLYLRWWSVTSDFWCYYCDLVGTTGWKTMSLTDKYGVYSGCSLISCSCLSPSPQVSIFPETQKYQNQSN